MSQETDAWPKDDYFQTPVLKKFSKLLYLRNSALKTGSMPINNE